MKNLLIIITSLLLMSGACETSVQFENDMPDGYTNRIDKGNGWTQFDLDGNTYLHHKSGNTYEGYECVTQIK